MTSILPPATTHQTIIPQDKWAEHVIFPDMCGWWFCRIAKSVNPLVRDLAHPLDWKIFIEVRHIGWTEADIKSHQEDFDLPKGRPRNKKFVDTYLPMPHASQLPTERLDFSKTYVILWHVYIYLLPWPCLEESFLPCPVWPWLMADPPHLSNASSLGLPPFASSAMALRIRSPEPRLGGRRTQVLGDFAIHPRIKLCSFFIMWKVSMRKNGMVLRKETSELFVPSWWSPEFINPWLLNLGIWVLIKVYNQLLLQCNPPKVRPGAGSMTSQKYPASCLSSVLS